MDVDPTNPIVTLIRILVILLLMFFGVSSVTREPPVEVQSGDLGQGGGGINRSATVIEKVETVTLESYPYQIMLN
ncbi:MAG: hypothetical protein K8I30_13690, partial [Anaerolineae bacterium]|nr:hypothetical protein [Anaerolineae bacterium]